METKFFEPALMDMLVKSRQAMIGNELPSEEVNLKYVLDALLEELTSMHTDMNTRLNNINTSINTMNTNLGGKLDTISTKLDTLGTKIDSINTNLDTLDVNTDEIETKLTAIQNNTSASANDIAKMVPSTVGIVAAGDTTFTTLSSTGVVLCNITDEDIEVTITTPGASASQTIVLQPGWNPVIVGSITGATADTLIYGY